MHTKQQERLAIAVLLSVTLAWGATFVVVKDGISQMPFMSLMTWRFTIAFVLLATMRPKALRVDRVTLYQGGVIGLLGFLGYFFQTMGLQYTTASVSGFITGMFVVVTPFGAWLIFRQRIGGEVWVATIAATVGLALISLRGWSFGVGEAWTLAGAAVWAFQILYFAKWSTRDNAYSLGTIMIGVVAVLFAIGTAPQGFVVPPSASVWWGVIGTAVFATAFAFTAQPWGQSHLDASRAAIIFTMEPVFAAFFGVVFGGDVLSGRALLGAACILASMVIAEFGGRGRQELESVPHPPV